MLFGPDNFLKHLAGLVTGDPGVLTDVPVPLSAVDLNTTRTVDTTTSDAAQAVDESGAYLAADETNARVIHVDEATDTIGHLTLPIPRDYDEHSDELKVRVLASMVSVSTDDDVELDSEVYIKTPGEALTADQDPDAPGTVLSTTEQWIEFDLSELDLSRDDVVIFKLITNGANDTDGEEVLIHAVEVVYRSTVVAYDESARD